MDDGVGMTEEQVKALNDGETIFSNGIGLMNVLRRVKEIPHATLSITSKKDEGTTMVFIQPLKELPYVENYYGRG